MRTSYGDYLTRKRQEYGDKFDPSDLAPEFVRWFESDERVQVRMAWGEVISGRIGVTTGWRPAFLLMRRVSDHGSHLLLGREDHVIAVQQGRKYAALSAS